MKVLNTILGSEAVKELSDQLQLLGSIEKHKNVISFIGAVVHTQSASWSMRIIIALTYCTDEECAMCF